MKRCHTLLLASLFGLLGLGQVPLLYAQDANNVLGLPAVPQRPAAPPTAGASAAQKAVATKPTDAQIKSVLSGKITAASSYQNGLLTVRVTTEKTFMDNAARAQALQAARLIQRDARLACGNLCKPATMPVPVIQANNTLSFDIVVDGYQGNMSTPDMINLISGKRVGAAAQTAPEIADPPVSPPASSASAADAASAASRP
jgi:hypothetical protein